ncbi:MAG: hypothetical protein VX619_07700 [bacterium]|nr:hypothetical protein [bacterium]
MQVDEAVLQLFLEEILADNRIVAREKVLISSYCKAFDVSAETYSKVYKLAKSEVQRRGSQPAVFDGMSFYLELQSMLEGHANEDSILLAVRQFLGLDYSKIEKSQIHQRVYENILRIYLIEVLTDANWSSTEIECLSKLLSILKISRRKFLHIYDEFKSQKIAYRKTHFISDIDLINKIKSVISEEDHSQIKTFESIKEIIGIHFHELPPIPEFYDQEGYQDDLEEPNNPLNLSEDDSLSVTKPVNALKLKMGSHMQWLDYDCLKINPRKLSFSAKLQVSLVSHYALMIAICASLIFSLVPLGGIQLLEERYLFREPLAFTTGKVTEVSYSSDLGYGEVKIAYLFDHIGETYEGVVYVNDLDGSYRSLLSTSVEIEYRTDDPFISRIDGIPSESLSQNFYDCVYLLCFLLIILYWRFSVYQKYCTFLEEGEVSLGQIIRDSTFNHNISGMVIEGSYAETKLNTIRFTDSLIIPNQKVLLFHGTNQLDDALVWEDLKDLLHFKNGEFQSLNTKMNQELSYLVLVLPAVIFVAMHELRTVLDVVSSVIWSFGQFLYWFYYF